MNLANAAHRGIVRPLRMISHLRGAGRISKLARDFCLKAGALPIQTVTLRDGSRFRLDLRSNTEWFSVYSGRYDDEIIELISTVLLEKGGNFLDVGGNIGLYAIRVALRSNLQQVSLAFEPMPENIKRLRANAELNGVSDRVIAVEMALSDVSGNANLVLREDFADGSETGNASIAISDGEDTNFSRISIQKETFDNIRSDYSFGEFAAVKVDIEGHEDFFFKGASEFIAQQKPLIFTEINNWYYERRGVLLSNAFRSSLISGYRPALLKVKGGLISVEECYFEDLDECTGLENCVLVYEGQLDSIKKLVGKLNSKD